MEQTLIKGVSHIPDNKEIEEFIGNQVRERKLDERTVKAYRMDLEHLYRWLRETERDIKDSKAVETYLKYLSNEKKLRASTVTRKYRVFCCYMEYLFRQKCLSNRPALKPPVMADTDTAVRGDNVLSKAEIDSFFIALNREYENLDNDFRRRVCLRDSVMMELLFYHGIEISELLRLEVAHYERETGTLSIPGKRNKQRTVRLFSKNLREKMDQWISIHPYFERDDPYENCLFLSKMGKPLSMKMVIRVFDKYRVMAGIEKECTPKDLKRSMKNYAQELMMERCG